MSSNGVFVVGVGMTRLGKMPDRSVKEFTREAVTNALTDAGASVEQIEAAWFSNTRQAMLEGQNTVRGQIALRPLGFDGIPIANIENACASGSTALLQAVAHLKAGMADVALVVGAENFSPTSATRCWPPSGVARTFTRLRRRRSGSAGLRPTSCRLMPKSPQNEVSLWMSMLRSPGSI
jgi:acetyl-CoA acetyltransferase